MQAVYKNEDERGSSRRTDPMSAVLHVERISGCLEGEYIGGFESRNIGIRDGGRIFNRY